MIISLLCVNTFVLLRSPKESFLHFVEKSIIKSINLLYFYWLRYMYEYEFMYSRFLVTLDLFNILLSNLYIIEILYNVNVQSKLFKYMY